MMMTMQIYPNMIYGVQIMKQSHRLKLKTKIPKIVQTLVTRANRFQLVHHRRAVHRRQIRPVQAEVHSPEVIEGIQTLIPDPDLNPVLTPRKRTILDVNHAPIVAKEVAQSQTPLHLRLERHFLHRAVSDLVPALDHDHHTVIAAAKIRVDPDHEVVHPFIALADLSILMIRSDVKQSQTYS